MPISDEHKDLVNYLEKTIKIIEKMGMRILDFQKHSVKIKLPKEPNMNHLGTVYAGSLFSLADYAGGVLFYASFDGKKYYPLLKEVNDRLQEACDHGYYGGGINAPHTG